MKRKSILIAGGTILLLLLAFGIFVLISKKQGISVYGTYRPYSSDHRLRKILHAQNTYLRVNNNHLIVYNTTVMGKPKFHFEGAFTVDHKTNTLNIHWVGGKLPKHLKVEKYGEDCIIRIGETVYKKEQPKI